MIRVQVLFFHPVDTEAELDILFLDHRLRQVYKVLHSFHDRERQRVEIELSALHLGDIQNIVDQCEQMIAGKADLSKAFSCSLHIAEVFLGDRRKSDDCVHGRANVV